MTRFERQKTPILNFAIWLSVTAVFLVDLLTPLGISVWVLYLVSVTLCIYTWRPRLPLAVAGACTALVAAGFVLSPPALRGWPSWLSVLNRSMGTVAIWAVAFLARRAIVSSLLLHEQVRLRSERDFSARLRGDQTPRELGENILRFLCEYFEAPVGVLYTVERDGTARRLANYALGKDAGAPEIVEPGEGLLGQAVKDKRLLSVSDVPATYLHLSSSLGRAAAAQVVVVPTQVDGEVNGAIELGFAHHAGTSDIELLEAVAEPVAIALRSSRDRVRQAELLEKTQHQAEELQEQQAELQTQQEELRVSNDELEEQVQAVTRSREGLARLANASLAVIGKADLGEVLQAVADAALALTDARLATCGHGYVSGRYVVGGSARVAGAPACPPGEMFQLDKGGVHMALVEGAESIRLTDTELRNHAKWWGLPEGHVPMRGLLGVRMLARNGKPNGMILVTDKENGDFTEEDEVLLRQLATVASLALQSVETRISLEEADRRKNQFLAMLSHELRNPLAPVRNSLYILDQSKPGSEQARRAKSVIDRQVGHLTRLVEDLLDVTRISRGKIQIQRERVDLRDLARRAVEDYREAFEQSNVSLELSLADDVLWVNADRTRLAQATGNLLGNAVKFTPAGGKAIVSVECNTKLGQAVLRVRDTGIGIAPDMLPRVFEPFAQADTTLDRSRGGLGLGLALVKGLVELHGGTASAESAGLDKGAEFTVRLPLEPQGVAVAVATPRRAAIQGVARRILVIEDNADAAESLREVLELNDHTVEVAFTGPEGLEKAHSFMPDVVLCDIGLPGMDGYEVARMMRRAQSLRGTKLVALTGYAAPEDVAKARDAGFDVHLAKPPSAEKIERVLSGSDDGGDQPLMS
jgi:signal transduction histidine kinase/ActR/RegA family two-component response regulator